MTNLASIVLLLSLLSGSIKDLYPLTQEGSLEIEKKGFSKTNIFKEKYEALKLKFFIWVGGLKEKMNSEGEGGTDNSLTLLFAVL